MKIITGKWTEDGLEKLIREAAKIGPPGERVSFLSGHFLGTSYKESTLAGDAETPEELVVDLEGMDCFTYIDYIEAMRRSGSFSGFIENLKKVRYRGGRVAFNERRHFFTDWCEDGSNLVEDASALIGGDRTVTVEKTLNKKDGGAYVSGVPVIKRRVRCVPAPLPPEAFDRLLAGDYAGIYSGSPGLDVTHVGIIIKEKGIFLRHASSRHMKVVDEDFREYISGKPGLIILRPK